MTVFTLRIAALALLLALLSACGQKGPLYLPGEGPDSAAADGGETQREAADAVDAEQPQPDTLEPGS